MTDRRGFVFLNLNQGGKYYESRKESFERSTRQNGEPVNISLVKWNLGDIVNKTHVVLIIGQNKMCAKLRTLPNDFSVYSMHQIVMPGYNMKILFIQLVSWNFAN